MALYTFTCRNSKCGKQFDLTRSMADDAPTRPDSGTRADRLHRNAPAECPDCGTLAERVAVQPGVGALVPHHWNNHIHTTGRPLSSEGHALVRNRRKWNAT